MKTRLISLIIFSAISVAACGAAAAPSIPPTPVSTSTPITLPTATPATPGPGGGPPPKAESAKWNNAPQAALNARQMLVDELKVDIDTISLVSVEQVDWPDACLGVKQEGVACAQIIVTGYKIVLGANGQEYEFHTNETGDVVRLVK